METGAAMDDRALQLWRYRKRLRGQCSSAAMARDYDVFLNHRGPDVKAGFVAHLDEALRAAGLNPFLDKASLRKGHPAFTSIEDALQVAKVHVVVVSKGYAESKYCLSELVTIMRSGKPVVPVFYDVKPMEVRWVENGPFAAAFEKHKSKRTVEQVEEWKDALCKLADITGFCFCLSDYKGDERELKWEVVDAILSMIPTNFEELQVGCHLVGVEDHVNTYINKLEKMSEITCLLGLVGMGGVGKTTIAKKIYNHFLVHKKFQATSFLEIDRHSPSSMYVERSLLTRLQEQLLWDLLQVSDNNRQRYIYWFNKLSSQGPVLIVLDDLYEKSQFDEVILDKRLLPQRSCVIVTSQDQHLLKVIGGESNFHLYKVLPLGCDDAEKLFNLYAFDSKEAPEKFKALANDVTKGCDGLPLALKVVGSSLFDKKSNEDPKYIWPEAIDALKEDSTIMSALKWSYNCLSIQEKLMFVDIACIFYGWKKKNALEIWKSCNKCSSCCGFGAPHITLNKLIEKSLVVLNYGNALAMHSLLRDLCESIGRYDGSHLLEGNAIKAIEDKNQGSLNNVRALNLSNIEMYTFESENFGKMPNLHFLILDGCNMSGNFGSISKELRWLRWRYMPLMQSPLILNFSRLISLDFSRSMELANIWTESNPFLEACPNLLELNLSDCTSITMLPDSIGCLSRLQQLYLDGCNSLQKLPSSIGQLSALQELHLMLCKSLEALPDTITALSGLQRLTMNYCSWNLKLPTTFGLMTNLTELYTDLQTNWQAVAIGQLKALKRLVASECTEEAITVLVSSNALKTLDHLEFYTCHSLTKLPEAIGLLTHLDWLELTYCWNLRKLPNSVGQLKVLRALRLRECLALRTLPSSIGTLACLWKLSILNCISFTTLPTSISHLSNLRSLRLEGCDALQSLPECVRHMNALEYLMILDCGSLEGLGVVRALQGLRIWGCTSITELPGSCLMVVDSNEFHPACYDDLDKLLPVFRELKQLQVVEANDCGLLRLVVEPRSGRVIWQRVHKLPCCNPPVSDLCCGTASMEVGESSNIVEPITFSLISRDHNDDAV